MTADNPQQPIQFSLERIYLKDLSYEAPSVPRVFTAETKPELNVQLGIQYQSLGDGSGVYEVVLHVTAAAQESDKTIFLVELQQAGVFGITGAMGEALAKTLEISCAHVLLPFAREAVNDIVGKGGFPQLLIAPINFELLYEQKQAATRNQKQQ